MRQRKATEIKGGIVADHHRLGVYPLGNRQDRVPGRLQQLGQITGSQRHNANRPQSAENLVADQIECRYHIPLLRRDAQLGQPASQQRRAIAR